MSDSSKAIVQPPPEYPPLARQARIPGQVQIDAGLDEQGNVVGMRITSGPLLYQAAQDALRKWKYEPTDLNDQPIAVQVIVTITFVLGQQQGRVWTEGVEHCSSGDSTL